MRKEIRKTESEGVGAKIKNGKQEWECIIQSIENKGFYKDDAQMEEQKWEQTEVKKKKRRERVQIKNEREQQRKE